MSSYLPYNPRWTAKLLRRDIHNLKAKVVHKVKNRLARRSKPYTEEDKMLKTKLETLQLSETTVPTTEAGDSFDGLSGAQASCRLKAFAGDVNTIKINYEALSSTESTLSTAEDVDRFDGFSGVHACPLHPEPSTLYTLLEEQLKNLWTSRNHNVSHEERWQFRGSWLVLCTAIQACPSNPIYDIFPKSKADETELRLQLLKLSTSNSSGNKMRPRKTSAILCDSSKDLVRCDSAVSNNALCGHIAPDSTPSQIWHSILEAVTDGSKTISIADQLLRYIWPPTNAAAVLDAIGDPSKTFLDADELRLQFRDILSPLSTASSAKL